MWAMCPCPCILDVTPFRYFSICYSAFGFKVGNGKKNLLNVCKSLLNYFSYYSKLLYHRHHFLWLNLCFYVIRIQLRLNISISVSIFKFQLNGKTEICGSLVEWYCPCTLIVTLIEYSYCMLCGGNKYFDC